MTFSSDGDIRPTETIENVACPFCGIVCDDLTVSTQDGVIKIRKNACSKALAGFERPTAVAHPQIRGQDVSPGDAVAHVAGLLRNAKLPLFGGLATDVDGMRSVMSLADRSGGVVDHALSDGLDRNISVLHSNGWITSSLTEARNRADLIIIAGSDIHTMHPRFFERILCAPETLFSEEPLKRTVVFIGEGLDTAGAVGPTIGETTTLTCDNENVGEILSALRARLHGSPVHSESVAGVAIGELDRLAEKCRAAAYGLVVWAPPSFDYPRGDLTVQTITELVRDLNEKGRFAGLSLGGNEGVVTAVAVCSWQSGFPLHTSFANGAPDYDPANYSVKRMLANGEGDLLIWITSFTADIALPATSLPTVVLGIPQLSHGHTPEVFIPVGTPGVDHSGRLIRCDNVVSLPLKKLRQSLFPSVANVLDAIEASI